MIYWFAFIILITWFQRPKSSIHQHMDSILTSAVGSERCRWYSTHEAICLEFNILPVNGDMLSYLMHTINKSGI